MPRCSVEGCKQMGSHTFPKNPDLRKVWEIATNKENFKASKHSRLCSKHFMDSDYIQVCVTTGLTPFHRYLKRTAVPSIFISNEQTSTVISENKDKPGKPTCHQQISRHLKKGVVPSIFPWTEKSSALTTGATQLETAASSPLKKPVLKESVVPPQNMSQEHENNSTEKTELLRDRSVRLKNRKAYLANRRCSIPLCNSRPSNEVSLHPCPNNAAVRNEWAETLKVSYQYIKNMVLCSKHFTKIDFVQSKNVEHRALKQNAVPSRNLPNRKSPVMPVKHKPTKKLVSSKAFRRQKTMTETVDERTKVVQDDEIRECRACLKKFDDKNSICNVFQAWAPPWFGMEATIAEDLAKIANVEISVTDRHSKLICSPCYQRLLDAATFASSVRTCDLLLRQRYPADVDEEKEWPKPIQVDKNINGSVYTNTLDIEIKQEVVSDDEYMSNRADNSYVESELANLDIKIEPEEFVEPPPMNITINGTISLDPLNSENKKLNGTAEYQEEQCLQLLVKQEPMSDEEHETEQTPDLPLECLLCTKSFNSVTGLKAHVIAQHSYKSVKRKSDGSISPQKKRTDKHQCAICRRSFQTPTDLMVHETCHNKHACYGCTQKFDSFELLSRHRKRCKASIVKSVQKLKTLEDVKRPSPDGNLENIESETEKKEVEKVKEEADSEVKSEKDEVESEEHELKSETKDVVSEKNELDCEIKVVVSDKNELECVMKEVVSEKNELESEMKELEKNEIQNDETKDDSEMKEVESEKEEANQQDRKMKLNLEIHSNKGEIESPFVDTDMQVETLPNDST